jgi:NAD(P)H-nitrite reductase large subunit
MAKRDPANKKVYVIIGGGPAGLNCAETLRQSNYTGEILVISDDNLMPYDRTLLTKVIATGNASKFKLREDSFLAAHDINYKLNTRAQSVDTTAKTVKLSDGSVISYDKLCVATGGAPMKPPIKGIEHQNVMFLRSGKDQEAIKQRATSSKNIVIIGAGFIGSEAASSLKMHLKETANVHMIGGTSVPMEFQLGKEVGATIMGEHAKNGVVVHMSKQVT